MSAGVKARLRRWAILIASALALFGWAAAAAADDLPPLPDVDSGEPLPRAHQVAATAPADELEKEKELEQRILVHLPQKWDDAAILSEAAVELNSILASDEREHRLISWNLADGICQSLRRGQEMAVNLTPPVRAAFQQSLCIASLAGGRPSDAADCARKLTKSDGRQGWAWLALFWACMLSGDKAGCDAAAAKLEPLIPKEAAEALAQLKWQAEPIGQQPSFTIPLSDKTQFIADKARGQVVVFDIWAVTEKAYTASYPAVRQLYTTFKDYPAFRMIGVNVDGKEFQAVAEQYMKANGMVWPTHFEGRSEGPISFKVFKSRRLPSLAVLSPSGKVVYLGGPEDPMLHYAIRAGLVEANKGRMPTSQPGSGKPSISVVQPSLPLSVPPKRAADLDARAAQQTEQEQAAQKLLNTATLYEQANFEAKALEVYREIVRKYPDTFAAVVAKSRLPEAGP